MLEIVSNQKVRREFIWILVGVGVAAVLALFVNLQVGVWFLVGLAAGWWTWQNPVAAVSFLVVLMPLLPSFKITQTIGTFTLIKDVMIAVLFVRLCAWPFITQTLPYRRNVLWWPVLALGIWTIVSMLRADSLVLGVLRAREIGLYVLLYFAVIYMPKNKSRERQWLNWGLLALGITMILAVYQWWWAVDSAVLRFDPGQNIWIPRVSSVMGHPSVFGEYLIMGICLLTAIFLGNKSKWRWAALLSAGMVAILIYLTYSRAVWMGMLVGLGVIGMTYAWFLVKQKVTKRKLVRGVTLIGVLGSLTLAGILMFTNAKVFVRSIFDPTYGSNEERIEFMVRLIAPVSNAQALFGAGLGNVLQQNFRDTDVSGYDIVSGESRTIQLAKDSTLVDNQYLKTFIEMGLVGILIYVWIYWVIAKQGWKLVMNNNKDGVVMGLWGLGFLAAFGLQALFIDIWDIFPTNLIFWLMAGVLASRSS